MFNCFLSLSVSVPVSDAYVYVLFVIVFFILISGFLDIFVFLKKKFLALIVQNEVVRLLRIIHIPSVILSFITSVTTKPP